MPPASITAFPVDIEARIERPARVDPLDHNVESAVAGEHEFPVGLALLGVHSPTLRGTRLVLATPKLGSNAPASASVCPVLNATLAITAKTV